MDVIHFTDLQALAHHGAIQRGVRYVMCHHRPTSECMGDFDGDWDFETGEFRRYRPSAYAEEIVTASLLEYHDYASSELRAGKTDGFWARRADRAEEFSPAIEKKPMFFYYRKAYPWEQRKGLVLEHCYATDAVLFPNYMLDVNALLRENIRVDLTPWVGQEIK